MNKKFIAPLQIEGKKAMISTCQDGNKGLVIPCKCRK